MSEDEDVMITSIVKISSMIIMFLLIMIVGSIPIRVKAFKSNKKLLAFTAAFSGGLFLSVGLLHLLPEAVEQMDNYYEQQGKVGDHFPFPFLITILSFALILWIEKIATDAHTHSDDNEHHHDNKVSFQDGNQQYLVDPSQVRISNNVNSTLQGSSGNYGEMADEAAFKDAISTSARIAKKVSFAAVARKSLMKNPRASIVQKQMNQLAPYILQIAIGIHAVFEGLAIGIEKDVGTCVGIAAAVVCHKWAEGLTLGLAFRQAGVDTKTSTIMIFIQAVMNPVGIALGWILSNQGFLVTSVFESVSAGTFLYIATVEVIVEEFNIARYKWQKFMFFLIAIAFVSSIWFMEQLTE